MNIHQFYITLAGGTLALILSITTIVLGTTNNKLQREFQLQQAEINKGSMAVQLSRNILTDMAQLSLQNPKIKEILAKHGYTVNVNPAPANN